MAVVPAAPGSRMNQHRILFSISLAISLLQLSAIAPAIADDLPNSGLDMKLYKTSKWQLPSCGVLKNAEPPHAAAQAVEEEFPTPASVEAAEKKAAIAKKAAKVAAAAAKNAGESSTAAGQPPTPASTQSPSVPVASRAPVPAMHDSEEEAPVNKPGRSQEGSIVRLTISPGDREKTEPAAPATATAISRKPASPRTNVTPPPTLSNDQMPVSAPTNTGAPVPGGTRNAHVRSPGKVAGKADTHA